jgi:hypothetical protein
VGSRRAILTAVTLVFAFAFAASTALAGSDFTLHPSGFGTMSYSAWKAKEGKPDRTGNQFQALYFQKMTVTATFAAGAAVIKG